MQLIKNPLLGNSLLPVEVVFHPSWWFHNYGITFEEDFFYHPKKRVEVELKMENALYERFGEFGLGVDHGKKLPVIGAVHLAAGFIISEMMGCEVEYKEDAPPRVLAANIEKLEVEPEQAFNSEIFRKFKKLAEELKRGYGYLLGDLNWGGILNIALDLRGENIFYDIHDNPENALRFFMSIARILETFTREVEAQTGTTSISVNRNVAHFIHPVFLHSECSHTMISVKDYEAVLINFDIEWSKHRRPFGIHYCGNDPHRYAEAFSKIPNVDFLDVGWGGDVKLLRQHLPKTFLNIRLNPVEMPGYLPKTIHDSIVKLVDDSGNPWLTGVCCINMDEKVPDRNVTAIFETVLELRKHYWKLAGDK
ncbi:MAG: hypothetical protein AB1798_06880 [Spirochaetota bacterium]